MRKRNYKNKTSKLKKYKGGAFSSSSYVELEKMKELFEIIANIKNISPDEMKIIDDLLNKNDELLKNKIKEIIKIIKTILQNNRDNPNDEPKINIAIDELSQHVQNLATRKYKSRGARVGSIIGEVAGHGTQIAAVGVGKATVRAGKAIGSGFRNIFGRRTAKSSGNVSGASATNGDIEVARGKKDNASPALTSKLENRLNNKRQANYARAAREANGVRGEKPLPKVEKSGNGAGPITDPAVVSSTVLDPNAAATNNPSDDVNPAIPTTIPRSLIGARNLKATTPPNPSNKDSVFVSVASKKYDQITKRKQNPKINTMKNRKEQLKQNGDFNPEIAKKIRKGIEGTKPGASI